MRDKNNQMLGFLYRSRSKMQQLVTTVEKLQQTWLEKQGENQESAKASDDPLIKLGALAMSEKLQSLTEAASTMFEDLVGYQSAQFTSDLTAMAADIEKECSGFHISGAKNWKAELANDESVYKIFDAAALVKVNPAQLMKAPTEFLKALVRLNGYATMQQKSLLDC